MIEPITVVEKHADGSVSVTHATQEYLGPALDTWGDRAASALSLAQFYREKAQEVPDPDMRDVLLDKAEWWATRAAMWRGEIE